MGRLKRDKSGALVRKNRGIRDHRDLSDREKLGHQMADEELNLDDDPADFGYRDSEMRFADERRGSNGYPPPVDELLR